MARGAPAGVRSAGFAIVSAWTSKPTNRNFFIAGSQSYVALRHDLLSDPQRNPPLANREPVIPLSLGHGALARQHAFHHIVKLSRGGRPRQHPAIHDERRRTLYIELLT